MNRREALFATGALLAAAGTAQAAEALYGEAAACEPLDAMERLDVEAAREELADE